MKGKHTCGKKHVAKVVEFTPFSLKKFLAEQIGTYAEIINSMQAIPGQWNLHDEIISLKLYSKGTLEFLNGTMPLLRGNIFHFSFSKTFECHYCKALYRVGEFKSNGKIDRSGKLDIEVFSGEKLC